MKPIQLWFPLLNSTLSDAATMRDSQRAFEWWQGEWTVWALPESRKPYGWKEDSGQNLLAIQSERFDQINVFHIGRNGYVFGADTYFPTGQVNDLLDAWLNLKSFELYDAPETITLPVPELLEESVTYREREFHVRPKNMFPSIQ